MNEETLAQDYTEGTMTIPQIADKYGMTVNDVQQFAFDRNLSHCSFESLIRRGVQLRKAYAGNGPENSLTICREDHGALVPALPQSATEVKSRHRMTIDGLLNLQEMLLESASFEMMAVLDPARFHPDDKRLQAARMIRGQKMSAVEQAKAIAELAEKTYKLDLDSEGHETAKAAREAAATNIQINNVTGQATNQNQTAIDERSKLAAVAGMLEMFKARKIVGEAEF